MNQFSDLNSVTFDFICRHLATQVSETCLFVELPQHQLLVVNTLTIEYYYYYN